MVTFRHDRGRVTPNPGGAAEELLEQVLKLASESRLRFGTVWWPSVDVFEVEDGFVVIADLAGVDQHDMSLSVASGRLHLSGVRRPPAVPDGHGVRQLEIDYGPFARTITFDPRVDEEGIAAEYRSGFLLVRLPCRRSTRRVDIQVED